MLKSVIHGKTTFDTKYYRRFFDKYSKAEFERYVNWADGWLRFLDHYLDIKNGDGRKLLELGSSAGYFSRVFKNRGFDVVASDISSYIVKKARILQKDIEFLVVDVEKGINIKKSFDYIVAFEVVEHLKEPENAFKNIYKKLRKGGVLIISTPFPTKRAFADPAHVSVHEPSWWLRLAKKTGFRKSRTIYATFVPFLYRISKYLSFGFPFKSDVPYVNSTIFLIFKK